MSDGTYGFFSAAGESMAQRLIGGVVSDVQADRTSRRKALDRVAEAVERIAGTEGMQADQDTLDAVSARLDAPFRNAGFVAISGPDLRAYCEDWSRRGTKASAADACPAVVLEAGRAVRRLSACAEGIARRPGVSLATSPIAPWEIGFCDADGHPPAEIVLFPWRGDVAGDAYVGCAVFSENGGAFVEDIVLGGRDAAITQGVFGARGKAEASDLFGELVRLQADLSRFNAASAIATQPGRLGIATRNGPGPLVEAMWDGDPFPSEPLPALRRPGVPVAVDAAVDVLGFENEAPSMF